jgi:hypothetical protein
MSWTRAGCCCGLLIVAVLGSPRSSIATSIVDQSHTEGTGLTALVNLGFDLVGQSFTAGVTGDLTAVRVDVGAAPANDGQLLRVLVFGTIDGEPTSIILGSQSVGATESLLSNLVSFDASIPITAGAQYAIAVDYPDTSRGTTLGAWGASVADLYSGGEIWLGNFVSGNHSGDVDWIRPSTDGDLHFETLVVPIPEPSTGILMLLGMVGMGARRRRRGVAGRPIR